MKPKETFDRIKILPYNVVMREWNLKAGDPLSLVLAFDARLGPTDYTDDQIWEIQLGGGDPPALSLNTTYGLRAKSARLFLRFAEGDLVRNDPAEFARPPEIRQVYPNFTTIVFSPFEGLDVVSEVWVPNSHAIAGRVSITNNARIERKIRSEVIGQLAPTDGQRMAPFEMSAATLLSGLTGGISPILFATGGAKAGTGPYPSLALTMQINPGESRQFIWAQAALADRDSSFAMARDIAAQNWEAEKSRIEMSNAGQVELFTGDPGWDAAFMLAQKQAASLLVGPTPNLPHASFVSTRQPDQGYSLRGDGSDYNHLWNGQTAMEARYLAENLLPASPELVKGLVRNFLFVQAESGEIDWKPGLGNQRCGLLSSPLLAGLVWRIFEQTEEGLFLEETFDMLYRFLKSWFSPVHDRDQDGIPELDNPLQYGLDYHPVYSRWQFASQGVDIIASEGPALCAMLYHECLALRDIAREIGREEEIQLLQATADRLKYAVEASWSESSACYFDWDRDTHIRTHGEVILEGRGPGNFVIRSDYTEPVRLLIEVRTDETVRRRPMIFVHGRGASGNKRVERIGDDQFRWMPGIGQLTGKFVYSRLERIEMLGLEPEDSFKISSVDFNYTDLTHLAPLWAGLAESERAEKLISETITFPALYWREFGLPTCPQPAGLADQQACWGMSLPWNAMIGEGLLRYGYRSQAAELLTRLMTAIVNSLKKDRSFRRSYHAETGQGIGEFNAVSGLAPMGLFLDVLGVRLISSKRVALAGFNPFPWPVTVKYRGMTILRQKDKTVVIFPDGQTVTVTDPEPRLVSLEVQE
jgi:hypothetical protein